MGRIRTIKPEFWTSETLAKVPIRARLTFAGVWTYVDDNGVGRDNHALIASEIYPLEPDPREARDSTREDLASLAEHGLIVRYIVDGRRYLKVNAWEEHQRIDRPSKPRYPQPEVDGAQILSMRQAYDLDIGAWPSLPPEPAAGVRERLARRAARQRIARFTMGGRRYVMVNPARPRRRTDDTRPDGRPDRAPADTRPASGQQPAQTRHVQQDSRRARETVAQPQRLEQGTGSREQGTEEREQGTANTLSLTAAPQPAMLALPGLEAAEPDAAVRSRPTRHERRPSEVAAAFDRFWATYPLRKGKADARKAWEKIAKDPLIDLELIIGGAMRYRDDGTRRRAGSQYTAHPATWLRGERWTDELQPEAAEPVLSTADIRVREAQAAAARLQAMEIRGELR